MDDTTIQDVIPGMREGNQVTELTADLTAKDNKIKSLTSTMIQLQNEFLENSNKSLQNKADSQISSQIVQQYFEKVCVHFNLLHKQYLHDLLILKTLFGCRFYHFWFMILT